MLVAFLCELCELETGLFALYPAVLSRFLTVLQEMALPGNQGCLKVVLESSDRRLVSLNRVLHCPVMSYEVCQVLECLPPHS